MRRFLLLALAVSACATLQPKGASAVFAAKSTLTTLEDQMASYCETADHDLAACAQAREAAALADNAIDAAEAAVRSGGDPSLALSVAKAQTEQIQVLVGGK